MSPNAGNHPDSTAAGEPRVQAMSPAVRKRLHQCYEHGTNLMGQPSYDFDYVHTLLVECVVHDPGNLVYLEAFLENLQRKYDNNKRGAILQFGGKGPFKKAVAREDWEEALRRGPEILKANPWDVATLRGLAEAARALGMYEAELRYLRNALEAKPTDSAINRHCARSLARVGRFDQAIACWQRVDEAERGDLEAQESIADLQIAKTQNRLGIPDGVPPRPSADKPSRKHKQEKSVSEEESRPAIQLTPRQELEQAIQLNPTNIDNYFQLADLHISSHRLGEAAHTLTRALGASGNDLRVQEKLEDVELLRKRQQVEIAERRAESGGDEAELAAGLRDDLNRYEIEIYDSRAQRYPGDLELKFQLGLRLKRAGNFREALEQFRLAEPLEARRAASIFEAGECLQRLKKYPESMDQYLRTAEISRGSEDSTILKLALYRAGMLASGLGNERAAEELFAELVNLEAGYRDAMSRLDKIRQMRHKG